MRLFLVIGAVACGLAAAAVTPPTASACCIWTPEADRIAGADVIFEGAAIEGPTETGVQRFRVTRYLKSTGPEVVSVKTRPALNAVMVAMTSVDLVVEAGSEWRIFGYGAANGVIGANSCTSRRLPLPPLGQEPVPPSGPGLVVQAPPQPPPAEERSSSDADLAGDVTSAPIQGPRDSLYPATLPLKKAARPSKVKRPLATKNSKKAKKRALRAQRVRRK
jgi:hypothetical protein